MNLGRITNEIFVKAKHCLQFPFKFYMMPGCQFVCQVQHSVSLELAYINGLSVVSEKNKLLKKKNLAFVKCKNDRKFTSIDRYFLFIF